MPKYNIFPHVKDSHGELWISRKKSLSPVDPHVGDLGTSPMSRWNSSFDFLSDLRCGKKEGTSNPENFNDHVEARYSTRLICDRRQAATGEMKISTLLPQSSGRAETKPDATLRRAAALHRNGCFLVVHTNRPLVFLHRCSTKLN